MTHTLAIAIVCAVVLVGLAGWAGVALNRRGSTPLYPKDGQ